LLSGLIYDEVWVFVNAWPTQTPAVAFDYNQTGMMTYTVQWQYDRLLTSTDLVKMQAGG